MTASLSYPVKLCDLASGLSRLEAAAVTYLNNYRNSVKARVPSVLTKTPFADQRHSRVVRTRGRRGPASTAAVSASTSSTCRARSSAASSNRPSCKAISRRVWSRRLVLQGSVRLVAQLEGPAAAVPGTPIVVCRPFLILKEHEANLLHCLQSDTVARCLVHEHFGHCGTQALQVDLQALKAGCRHILGLCAGAQAQP